MEKTARKPSADPLQERLRTSKAAWNKDVSAFINDLIHIKKTMNGWPSKFFKERSRITQPIPADPGTVIGALAGDFQDIANRGNSIVQQQLEYAKNRRQKQPKPAGGPQPGGAPASPEAPAAPEAPKPGGPDLSQQMGQQLAASSHRTEMIKVASSFEGKYLLESEASNPVSRFITRLFNPRFGFGEGARIRRLRMAMLDNCVKSYKELKKLHKEIVKSSKGSIVTSHKMMTQIWNYWNAVNRLLSTYKAIRPDAIVKDVGGPLESDPELKKEKAIEEGRDPEVDQAPPKEPSPGDTQATSTYLSLLKDYRSNASSIPAKSPAFHELSSIIEAVTAAPQDNKARVMLSFNVSDVYSKAITEVNAELGTSGSTFQEIAAQAKTQGATKQAQRQLGKIRHQILPGATSGQRLEMYQFIDQIKRDLDEVMDLLEEGFDQSKLTPAIGRVNREMAALRVMMRSLYYSEKPEEAGSPFF